MEYLLIGLVALLTSGLTFFSGFGLGTLLMPVLAFFFPVPIAIAATAVVHLANNLFKLLLIGRRANRAVLVRFAVPAALAALIGAWGLSLVALVPVVGTYQLLGKIHEITLVKFIIGLIIIAFSFFELSPRLARLALDRKYLTLGGLLSGFFGGLSGHQGALRSLFLIRAGLSKEEFIGTGVAAAVIVDLARLAVYGIGFFTVQFSAISEIKGLVLIATAGALVGALLGKKLLKKITVRTVQILVGVMLVGVGLALSSGLI